MIATADQHAHGFKRAAAVSKLTAKVSYLIATGHKDQAAHELSYGLYDLGGVYIKYLQMGATLVTDFPGLDKQLRSIIFDKVKHPDIDIHAVLREQLGPDYQQNLKNISAKPIAAGSFAGVYSATHRNGDQVIIKVLRPNLKKQLKTDLRLLGILTRSTQPFFRSDLVNLVGMYKEFRSSVFQETDYKTETANAISMANMYSNNPDIIIPESYPDLSTNKIIVQERLHGIPISTLLGKDLKGEAAVSYTADMLGSDLRLQLEIFGYAQHMSALEGPFVHGDIHPGNVFLLPNNKVGLIDFGSRLNRVSAPHSLFSVYQSEYTMHGANNDANVAEHATRVFKLYNEKVFLSMERISRELESKGVQLDIVRELRNLIEKIVEPSLPKIRESCRKGHGIPTELLLDSVNHNNQFALRIDEGIARIARNQALYWHSLGNMGLMKDIAPKVNKRIVDAVKARPDILGKAPQEPTLAEATEIFLDWFSELVERNPLMFGPLFAKMKIKLNKYNKETPQNA